MVNVAVWRILTERQRPELVASQLMRVDGTLGTRDVVLHERAGRLEDASELLQGPDLPSLDLP
ncbi:hypothetical protein CE139_20460 [Pseudomonas oryzihabitans]|uniref:Uncharacterized protein n=1 Tax=Pseudomonas oryzihabitans TaxID=47885 RepID=A0A2Z5ADW8_9PSED|nr:hypothetical protein CE139_20460 [Pseudomonas oryzihabitans]